MQIVREQTACYTVSSVAPGSEALEVALPPADQLLDMYRTMQKIRRFEEKVQQLFIAAKLRGVVHLYIGEEAIATGACAALKVSDYITSSHRGHGHCIAKGGDVRRMMAELFGRVTGYCKGKGGSMHIADLDLGILGANGIVGGGIPIAAGAALGAKVKGTDQVCVSFFGDGATNQGAFHESVNLAAVLKLPAIFVVENNGWGMSTPTDYSVPVCDVAMRAISYGMPGYCIDGNDVLEVYRAARLAVDRARRGEGPTLIECKTLRYGGHFQGDPQVYRDTSEADEWRQNRDAIDRFGSYLIEQGIADQTTLDRINDRLVAEVEDAVRFAEDSPVPPLDLLTQDVYAPDK